MKSVVVVFLLISHFSLNGQNFNRPVPERFPEYEFVIHDSTYTGVYLMAPFYTVPAARSNYDSFITILDNQGYILWYSSRKGHFYFDFEFEPNQNNFSFIDRSSGGGNFQILDSKFDRIDSVETLQGIMHDTHEFFVLDNGNYVISGTVDSLVDYSHLQFGEQQGSDSTYLQAFVIQEINQENRVVFEWNSNDHVNPLESYDSVYGYNPQRFDYCHGNAFEKDKDGNYLISFRHTNSIYKVNGITGQTIWKLGGKDSDFTFVNDGGFSGQHDIRVLENGNVTLYDNANMAPEPKKSRAVEYALDTTNWIATKVWEYIYDAGFFARAMGNYQRPYGNHLICYGTSQYPNPHAIHLNGNENIISELYLRDTAFTYRTYYFELPFEIERPAVQCINNQESVTLAAPNGYDSYYWSTGETTQSINVQKNGTYQVWVNHGIGMLGSSPIIIENMHTFCVTTSVGDLQQNKSQIESIWDLLGRKITKPRRNQLYIILYSDGRVEKQFWIDRG